MELSLVDGSGLVCVTSVEMSLNDGSGLGYFISVDYDLSIESE